MEIVEREDEARGDRLRAEAEGAEDAQLARHELTVEAGGLGGEAVDELAGAELAAGVGGIDAGVGGGCARVGGRSVGGVAGSLGGVAGAAAGGVLAVADAVLDIEVTRGEERGGSGGSIAEGYAWWPFSE
ncbi:hypothetical protein OV079_05455 [Nannocystis pusilla]|uniref:Uncharacterized protein n=1 Tax=Nannocystis pusilla TaxID=889268 RepID=A0A9X3EKU3_9BACT|nr:hypothetical protein [Nannocystis pusilla]MCY1005025.1 hypothetical protein [Nannocystis pusilla]